jgi:hypothetical protein
VRDRSRAVGSLTDEGLALSSDPANDDGASELVEVPAAVVCALCGSPDCLGCMHQEEPSHASGIVAIVPWERPGSAPKRLWQTSKMTTLSSEQFFGALPDGDVAPALRFAIAAELTAITGLLVVAIPVLLAFAPWLFDVISRDATLRMLIARLIAIGVPVLALGMVLIHAAHGYGLDLGARRQGAKVPKTSRGLRFGLYACGWDVMTQPAGLAFLACTDGIGAAWKAVPASLTVPRRAVRAYLRGAHRLDERAARAAARVGAWLAGGLVALGLGTLFVVIVLLAIL